MGWAEEFVNELAEKVAEKMEKRTKRQTVNTSTTGQPAKRMLDAKEAAHYIGRTVGALRHLVFTGEIKPSRFGRKLMFEVGYLNEWLDRHRGKTMDEKDGC